MNQELRIKKQKSHYWDFLVLQVMRKIILKNLKLIIFSFFVLRQVSGLMKFGLLLKEKRLFLVILPMKKLKIWRLFLLDSFKFTIFVMAMSFLLIFIFILSKIGIYDLFQD